jgi:hypothetical protein
MVFAGKQCRWVAPHHALNNPGYINAIGGFVRHEVPVAQHCNIIADLQQFLQLVRNINNRDAVRFQFSDHAKEHFHFCRAERRGGFVHDQDAHILRQGFGDLYNLLLADTQVAHQGVGINVLFQPPHQFTRLLLFGLFINHAALCQLARQENVIHYAQVGAQVEFLVNDADAIAHRVQRAAQANFFAIEQHTAAGGLLHAGQDFHQGGFTRPVFAHQYIDLACIDIEGHLVERNCARENLGDVFGAQDDILL